MCLPSSPRYDLRLYNACTAVNAASPKRVSLESAESVSNSSSRDPAPAVLAISVSPSGTPYRRFTVPYGIPVGVAKAGSRRSPTSRANLSN